MLFSQLLMNLDGAFKVRGNGRSAGGETLGRFTAVTSLQVEPWASADPSGSSSVPEETVPGLVSDWQRGQNRTARSSHSIL